MIDRKFWRQVAEHWKKESDGIEIPSTESDELAASRIVVDDMEWEEISDEEIEDIKAWFEGD